MGDFTDKAKVQSLFRRLKIEADTGSEKTNTVVTTEEVDQFILEAETMMKARLRTCYAIDPLTNIGTESLIILGTVAAYKVAQVIKNIMELTVNVSSERKNQDMTANWAKMASDMMDKICPEQSCGDCKEKPTMPLPDTPLVAAPPTGASLFSSSANTAQFTKTGPNW